MGELGAEDFRGLWAGSVSWTDARVTAALETFGRVLDYVNTDHSTLVWNEAAQLLADGSAAMTVMGDWTNSEFSRLRLQYNYEELAAGQSDHQLVLQYLMSIGAHGAHPF